MTKTPISLLRRYDMKYTVHVARPESQLKELFGVCVVSANATFGEKGETRDGSCNDNNVDDDVCRGAIGPVMGRNTKTSATSAAAAKSFL
jgi:hypothetical protein